MKLISLTKLLEVIDGQIVQGEANVLLRKICTLPNRVINGSAFFHLYKQKKMDDNLSKLNSSSVIVTEDPPLFFNKVDKKVTVVKVNSIKDAYWKFIHYYRNLFSIPVIGITGTCGKTTTTEMIKHILFNKYKIQATRRGANSTSYHLPYLLGIEEDTEVGIFEFGVAYPKDIIECCRYFQPQIGLLLNIETNHLAGCKTTENYIKAKADMFSCIKGNGTMIFNADDQRILQLDKSMFKGKCITFGLNENADYCAKNLEYKGDGMKFTLLYKGKQYDAFAPGVGKHQVSNALAAIAACCEVDLTIPDCIHELKSFEVIEQHLQFKVGKNGTVIIDDTWNNSTLAMKSGLQVLHDLKGSKKSIAVLGYMPQLQGAVHDEYKKIAKILEQLSIDEIITVGAEAKEIGISAIKYGVAETKVKNCNDGYELLEKIAPYLDEQTIILLKITHRVMKEPSFQYFINKISKNS